MHGGMRVLALVVAAIVPLGLAGCDRDKRDSEPLSVGGVELVPEWADKQGFADNPQAVRGAQVFAQVGCLTCHTYLGAGSSNLGAPDLSEIGRPGHRTAQGFAAYVSDPSKFGNQVMPRFEDLGERNLLALGAFLAASRGEP
jgi:mono/diheme cytochrome c family protein